MGTMGRIIFLIAAYHSKRDSSSPTSGSRFEGFRISYPM